MTVDEFLAWQPEDTRWRYELDAGKVIMSPSPFWWHQKAVMYVASELDHFVTERKLGEVCVSVDTVIDTQEGTVRCPDVYFVAQHRLPEVLKGHLLDAADLMVEVTSEGTRRTDFGKKFEQYDRNPAVKEYWILDIVESPMAAYLWHRRSGKLAGGKVRGAKLKSKLLKGFELDLKTVWARALEGRE